jgi:hypothetical protein
MNEAELTALSIAIGALKREGFIENVEVLKSLRTRLSLADGGKGEAVAGYVIPQRLNSDDPVISLYRKPEGGARFPLYAAPQAECAPQTDAEALYEAWQNTLKHMDTQAECAPREAQPVGPRTTLNYDGTFDTTCAHCGGNGCFACLKSAAPTPERADADTAGAKPTCPHCGLTDIEFSRVCHNSACSGYAKEESFYRGWENTAAPASQGRADAGKDAALLEALRKIAAIENKMYGGDWDEIEEARSIASIAILAANKEAPERAEPRALTDERAKEIAQQVHAECSRIPGATFYNAAMSAIEQAVKERK